MTAMRTPDEPSVARHSYAGRMSDAGPSISLIVPCYTTDRYEDLCRLIDSVRQQASPIDELIVVVQQSRQLETLLAERLARVNVCDVHLLFLDTVPAVSRARNRGLSEASCDIIAFADDDAILATDWALATRRFYLSHSDAIGVAGAILPLWDSPAMEWFPRELWWMLSCTYWTATTPVPVRNGYGANMSFRREAFDGGRAFNEFLGISGWDTSGWRGVGGEEPELALRITAGTGRPIMYVPDVSAWHRVRPSRLRCMSLSRRAYWEGMLKASLSASATSTPKVLRTEWTLLREMVCAHIGRLRLLLSRPRAALHQESAVILVVVIVALGFIHGRLRRIWTGVPGGSSNAREESAI